MTRRGAAALPLSHAGAGAARRTPPAQGQGRQSVRAYAAEVPVNKVCRMLQCKIAGEEEAVAMDALLNEADAVMKKVPGYVGSTRMVCKSYWDFKSVMVFEDVPALEGYMESDVKEKEMLPLLEKAKTLALDGDVKMQNFVYDQLA